MHTFPDDAQPVPAIDRAAFDAKLKLHDELFSQLHQHLPQALRDTKALLAARA